MLNFINYNSNTYCSLYAIFIYMASAYVIGSLFPLKDLRRPGLNLIKLIIGMDVITISGYLFGCSGFLTEKALIIILSSISFIGIFFLFFKHKSELKIKKIHLKKYSPLLIALSLLPLMLGRALCLPAGWDELTYQLAVPARWIQTGCITVFLDNPYSAFPSAASVNFYILMMSGGILTPRLFILSLWIITVISLYLLIKPGFSKWGASIMAFGFGSSFAVIMTAVSAYTELFILIQVIGIMFLFRNLHHSRTPTFIFGLAGLMAGIAASVKLTGLIIGAALFICILIIKIRNNEKFKLSAIYASLLTFGTVFIIFYARPYLFTGNPFYPFFSWLSSNHIPAIEMSQYHHLIGNVKYGIQGFYAFFTTPFLLAVSPDAFDGGFGYQLIIIFIFCIFSAVIAVKSRDIRTLSLISIAILFYTFWFFTAQQSRFLLPSVFILFIVAKYAIRQLSPKIFRLLILILLIISPLSIPDNFRKSCFLSWETVLGRIKPADYLYSSTGPGYLKSVDIVNTKLPQNTRIMLVFENRGLYFNKKYVIGTPFFQEKFFTPPEQISESSQIMDVFKREKITHVLIGLSDIDPDRLPEYLDRTAGFAKLLGSLVENKQLKKIWEDEGFGIYEVK